MKNFMMKIKSVIAKRSFLAKLSEEFGNPREMRDYLLSLTRENPWMSVFLKKDIDKLDKEVQAAWVEAEEERQAKLEAEAQNPCFSCSWGNGMGRCGSQMPIECEAAGRL